jgi:hypothetical protein
MYSSWGLIGEGKSKFKSGWLNKLEKFEINIPLIM